MKRHIPNLLTLGNLLSGCVGIVFALHDELLLAGLCVAIGIFFDFFDGLVARLLKVAGELGTQLDSLADMVTSGVVPGIVACQLLADSLLERPSGSGWNTGERLLQAPHSFEEFICLAGFLITAASGYRLAKFNIDTRQSDSFIGLPTPANAILIISLAIIAQTTTIDWLHNLLLSEWFLAGLIIVSCILLNAELYLFSLKFKTWGVAENWLRYGFVLLCVVLLVLLKIYAIPLIIILYILISVLDNLAFAKAS